MERRFYFQWHLTESCNLRCKHCYQNSDGYQDTISLDDFNLVLSRISTALMKWRLPGRVAVTGGEPFLIRNLYDLLRRLDDEPWLDFFDILSNGILIDDWTAKSCRAFTHLRRIQISLDGATEEVHDAIRGNGTFRKALSALNSLRNAGVTTSIMFTLFRSNRHQVRDILELARDYGCDSISIERLVPIGRGEHLSTEILNASELMNTYLDIWQASKILHASGSNLKVLKFRPLWAALDPNHTKAQSHLPATLQLGASCSIGLDAMTIMPDLSVLPCRRLPIPIGNLRTDTIFKIWYGSELLWKIRNKYNLKGRCHGCDLVALCGGCRAVAFSRTQDVMDEDPQCFYLKHSDSHLTDD